MKNGAFDDSTQFCDNWGLWVKLCKKNMGSLGEGDATNMVGVLTVFFMCQLRNVSVHPGGIIQ